MPADLIMQTRQLRHFLQSAGTLLLITAFAKLASSFGNARVLDIPDPVLSISFRDMFRFVGVLELMIALVCFFGKSVTIRAMFVAWLATSFIIYRIGLLWVHYSRPCGCLGNLTDALNISPETADIAAKVVLGYLLLGSYFSLFWLWKEHTPPPQVLPRARAIVG